MGTTEGYECAVKGCSAETINPGYAAEEGRIRPDGSWLCPEHRSGRASSS